MKSFLLLLGSMAPVAAAQTRNPITLEVDATEAPLKILHARLTVPVAAGPLTLVYPKWIPGEHMPSGPIGNLVGLHFEAGGRELEWRRDRVEMTAFHLDVPSGAAALVARYDFVIPTAPASFTTGPSANAKCCVLNWNTVVLSPAGESPDALQVKASLRIPAGWKNGGSLGIEAQSENEIRYAPTSLAMLIDHPVVLGEFFRRIELWPAGSEVGEHTIDAIADSSWALDFPDERIEAYKRLVREERAVFGGVGHYTKYHWLLTLSDLGQFGLEHHECSDDRVTEKTFVDDDSARRAYSLLPHEFFHAWNGKTRRPIGLATGGYEKPMQDDLLWVYEGLTNYYGEVLGPRAGLVSTVDWLETLAANAHAVSGPGRRWRPLQDTADAAVFLYTAGGAGWDGYRRGVDFYPEGSLIWLDADVQIRLLSNGAKSLDDFCAAFHGEGDNGRVYVEPYTAEDVYAALAKVQPADWKGFFEQRLRAKEGALPLDGIQAGGWELVYDAEPNGMSDAEGGVDATASLGISVAFDGAVSDSWPGSPAFAAGVGAGMKIIAVNGRKYAKDELERAIRASPDERGPIALILENGTYYSVVHVDYHGGTRHPHLSKKEGARDILNAIARPRLK